jgi:dTDP-4-amino-4,6-dideoxygalactose transaminase
MSAEKEYKVELSKFLQCAPDQLFLYWKGRIALYAALKAMGIQSGDEVILPAFTCVVVPNAIIYLGAKPIYVDIDQSTLNTTLDNIQSVISERTKCILIQNTFGLSSQVDEIVAFAKNKGIYTIEDCTHGFGGMYQNAPNGSRSDCSFYSSQWNKPFSTGVGGILLVNNRALIEPIETLNQYLQKPGFKARFMLRVLIFLYKYLITDRSYWVLIRMYRFLSKTGLVIGSSSNDEITSTKRFKCTGKRRC